MVECKYNFYGGVFSWHMLSLTLASAAVPALTLALWALSLRVLTTTSSATLASPAALALAPAPWAPLSRANYLTFSMPKKTAPDFRCCFSFFFKS
jgi:hypothetical protein